MKLIKNLLIGFCIGVTILTFSILIGEVFMENMPKEVFEELKLYMILSLFLGACIGAGITIGDKNKSKSTLEKKKILKNALIIIFILIIASTIVLIFTITNHFTLAINIILSSIIGALMLWEVGSFIGYKSLKKNE